MRLLEETPYMLMVNFADNPTIEEEYLALASLIMMAEHVDFDVPFKVVNDATKKTFNRISRNQKIYTFFWRLLK